MCWRQLWGNDAHKKGFFSSSLWDRQISADTQRYAGLHPFPISWCLLFEFWDERYLGIAQRKQSFRKTTCYIVVAQDRTKPKADSKDLGVISPWRYWAMPQSMGCWNQWGHQVGDKNFTLYAPWPPLWNIDLQNRTATFPTNWYIYFYTTFMILKDCSLAKETPPGKHKEQARQPPEEDN